MIGLISPRGWVTYLCCQVKMTLFDLLVNSLISLGSGQLHVVLLSISFFGFGTLNIQHSFLQYPDICQLRDFLTVRAVFYLMSLYIFSCPY